MAEHRKTSSAAHPAHDARGCPKLRSLTVGVAAKCTQGGAYYIDIDDVNNVNVSPLS